MRQAARKAVHPSKAEAVMRLMRFSRYGALAQLFILDAVFKALPDDVTARQPGEDNEALLARLLSTPHETAILCGIAVMGKAIAEAGEEGVCAQFDKSGASNMINPRAWYGVGMEVREALASAL